MFSRRSWRDSETLAIDAVDALPPRRGMTPDARRDEAISRGLAKRLEQLAAERERRERAAEKADAEFSNEFLNAARKCFEMIDDDQSGTLEKAEMSERCVRPSTFARRGDGERSAAALAVRRVWGRSYAIDATPYSPPDFHAASQLSSRTRKLSNS